MDCTNELRGISLSYFLFLTLIFNPLLFFFMLSSTKSDWHVNISQTLKWYAQHAAKKGTVNVENVFLQTGIVRDLVALFIKFGLLVSLPCSISFFSFSLFMFMFL